MRILPVVLMIPAVVVCVWGFLSGRLTPAAGTVGVLIFPLASYGLGSMLVLEGAKRVEFCGSCHIMTPIMEALKNDKTTLAGIHYSRGAVPIDEACYTCHSGYGIWGTLDAKVAGVDHMFRTLTGRYTFPIELDGTFNIDSCLGCHALAATFRNVEAHRDPDVQKALLSREMSCTGMCHPAAHPRSALVGPAGGTS